MVRWYKNGDQVSNTSPRRLSGGSLDSPALTIHSVREHDPAFYFCSATNQLGTGFGTPVKLIVIAPHSMFKDCTTERKGVDCITNCSHCAGDMICDPKTGDCFDQIETTTESGIPAKNIYSHVDDVKLYAAIAVFISNPGIIILVVWCLIMVKYFTALDPGILPPPTIKSTSVTYPNFEPRGPKISSYADQDPLYTSPSHLTGTQAKLSEPNLQSGTQQEPVASFHVQDPASRGGDLDEKSSIAGDVGEILSGNGNTHPSHEEPHVDDDAKQSVERSPVPPQNESERPINWFQQELGNRSSVSSTSLSDESIFLSKLSNASQPKDVCSYQGSPQPPGQHQASEGSIYQQANRPHGQSLSRLGSARLLTNSLSRIDAIPLPSHHPFNEILDFVKFRLLRYKAPPVPPTPGSGQEKGPQDGTVSPLREQCPQAPPSPRKKGTMRRPPASNQAGEIKPAQRTTVHWS